MDDRYAVVFHRLGAAARVEYVKLTTPTF